MKFKEGAKRPGRGELGSLARHRGRLGTDLTLGDRFSVVPPSATTATHAGWDLGTPGAKRIRKAVGWFQTDLGLQLHLGGWPSR
jgi:hypothetical protein